MERERGKENFKSWSSDKMWTWAEQRKKKKNGAGRNSYTPPTRPSDRPVRCSVPIRDQSINRQNYLNIHAANRINNSDYISLREFRKMHFYLKTYKREFQLKLAFIAQIRDISLRK